MRFSRYVSIPLVFLAFAATAAAPAAAQALTTTPADEEAAFVVRRGDMALAAERFTHTDEQVEAEVLSPNGQRIAYEAALRPDATVSRMTVRVFPAGAASTDAPARRITVELKGDSAFVEITQGTNTQTQRLGTRPGAIPILSISFAMVEQILRRAQDVGGGAATVPALQLSDGKTITVEASALGADSVRMTFQGEASGQVVHLKTQDGRILRGAVPAQNITIERAAPAQATAAVLGDVDYSAPPGAPYTAEEVRISTPAGHVLAGTLTLPKDASGPVPAVVTITGSNAQLRDHTASPSSPYRIFRQVADTLARRGIAVLRMDDRGMGGSTGTHATATTPERADDIRAALAFLRERPEIASKRLGLVGLSEGGMIAPMIAQADTALGGIVLLAAPGETGREVVEYQSALARQVAEAEEEDTVGPWMQWFLDYDPFPVARRVDDVPVLILHGTTDRQADPAHTEDLAAAFRQGGNPDVTVRMFENLNHLFLPDPDGDPAGYSQLSSYDVPPEVLGTMADWLAERLR